MNEYGIIMLAASVVLSLAGLAGLVLPLLPGAPLLFAGLLCAAWAEGFRHVGFWPLLLIGMLAATTYFIEFAASLIGAKRFGASSTALYGAAAGGVIGMFFGLPGIILGPLSGAVIGEIINQKSLADAGTAGVGTLIGMAAGAAGKVLIGVLMIFVFILARFI